MAKNLLIVESPAKAKTIEKYLGGDFTVQASFGHIRDLPKDDSAVDIEGGYEPIYQVSPDKAEVVSKLRSLAKKHEAVWLATDEDREGEAISWHLAEVLGLDPAKTKRIVFHEITKNAILKAVQQPRTIDMALVDAQQARRVLDRLVGFELSPILWKKVKFGLSAGRVQSVAVRIIVAREREIQAHTSTPYFNIAADLRTAKGEAFQAGLAKPLKNLAEAQAYLQAVNGAALRVTSVETKPAKRTPAAPFTTSTLQQEASRKLGYSVAQTMRLAQGLYEAGHITYMRTDSVNLSNDALAAAQHAISTDFGAQYHQRRTYKSKTANAQEAHEAIRPTDFHARTVPAERQEQRLYDLIWKRSVASQMADAQLEKTTVEIALEGKSIAPLVATGEVIKFDGFLKLYLESKDDGEEGEDQSGLLPALAVGDRPTLQRMTATERFTRPPARYTEASLVKALEEQGIGRPSTYAPTISTIQNRNYVVKEDREGTPRTYQVLTLESGKIAERTATENTGAERAKLFPTDLGSLVTDFLVHNFPDIVDYQFTARVEEEFDEIARGKLAWKQMLHTFFPPFREKVRQTEATASRVQGERSLGIDPKSGKPVVARLGRYGPIAQIGAQDDAEKQFASLRPEQRLETVTLEQALELFQLPRLVGKYEDAPVQANQGRFGPYVQHAGKFYSLPKGVDPRTVTIEEAGTIIEAKRKADSERIIQDLGEGVQVLNGRWGAYISDGIKNYKIPKTVDAAKLSHEEVRQLMADQADTARSVKKGRGAKTATKSAKSAAPKAAKPVRAKRDTGTVAAKPAAKKAAPKTAAAKTTKPSATAKKKPAK